MTMLTNTEQAPGIPTIEQRTVAILAPPTDEKRRRIDTKRYIEGYATTFTTPYLLAEWGGRKYYEAIAQDALCEADLSDVIMQYDHVGRVLARTTNGTLGIMADAHGLFVYADLSKSDAAKELYSDIRAGLVTKMSWAFSISEDAYNKDTCTRTITKIKKVYDVSAVSYPANPNTDIAARCGSPSVAARNIHAWLESHAADQSTLKHARGLQLLKLKTKLEATR